MYFKEYTRNWLLWLFPVREVRELRLESRREMLCMYVPVTLPNKTPKKTIRVMVSVGWDIQPSPTETARPLSMVSVVFLLSLLLFHLATILGWFFRSTILYDPLEQEQHLLISVSLTRYSLGIQKNLGAGMKMEEYKSSFSLASFYSPFPNPRYAPHLFVG